MLLAGDFMTTAQGVITLISGLIGLIAAAVSVVFMVKNLIKSFKDKNATEVFALLQEIADTAMKEAEASALKGSDKKQMVMNAVKAGAKAAGIDMDEFVDKLSDYIDQTISFVNDMTKK